MKFKFGLAAVSLMLTAALLGTSCTTTVVRRRKPSSSRPSSSAADSSEPADESSEPTESLWEPSDSSSENPVSSDTLVVSTPEGKKVELQTLSNFVRKDESPWTFDGGAEFVDYCEDFSKLHSRSGVRMESSDPVAAASTGESKRFSAEKSGQNAVLIYKVADIAAFDVTLYSTAFSYSVLKAFTSEDGKNWQPAALRICSNEDLAERYARVKMGSDENLPANQNYLKIEFTPAVQIGRVSVYTLSESYSKAPFGAEYAKSGNFKAETAGYRVTDAKTAWLEVYRYRVRAAAFRIRYKGGQPAVLLRFTEDGKTYKNAPAYRTPAVRDTDGYSVFYVITAGQLPDRADLLRLYLNKPDNTGKDVYVTGVKLCAGVYYDDCADFGELYVRPANLRTVTDKEGSFFAVTETGTASFVVNKNDIKGFNVSVRVKGNPSLKFSVSKNGKDFTEIAAYADDRRTSDTEGAQFVTYRNRAAVPADCDYFKIEFARGSGGTAEIDQIRLDAACDPVRELQKICKKKGVKFSDIFSIAHVGGWYTHSQTPALLEGMDIVKEMGGKSINLWLQAGLEGAPSTFSGYVFNSEWESGVVGQVNVMKTAYVRKALAYSNIKTFVLSYNPDTVNIQGMFSTFSRDTFDDFLKSEYQKTYDFCVYLLNTYKNSGKRFIVMTWESDWWFGNPNTGYDTATLDRFAEWVNNRQKAFEDARAKVKPTGMELYNCLEVVDMLTAMEGRPCVTTRVLPKTKCDMYAYSAYDTAINEVRFEEAMNTLRRYAPESKLLGKKNLIIGEVGLPEMEFGYDYTFTNLVKSYKKLINHDMQLGIMWQIYCNEPKNREDLNKINSHDNNDYRGFWLIRADGTKTPVYHVFRMALKS